MATSPQGEGGPATARSTNNTESARSPPPAFRADLYSPTTIPCFQGAFLTGTGLSSVCALGYYAFTRRIHVPLTLGVFTLGSMIRWFTCQSQLEEQRNDMEQLQLMQSFYEQKMVEAYSQHKRKQYEQEKNASDKVTSS